MIGHRQPPLVLYLSGSQWPAFNDEAVFVVQTKLPPATVASVTQVRTAIDPLLATADGARAATPLVAAAFTAVMTLLISDLPARRASRVDPSVVLRDDN